MAAPAISSGVPKRRTGIARKEASARSLFCVVTAVSLVGTSPGASPFTLIPSRAQDWPSVLVRLIAAALEAA